MAEMADACITIGTSDFRLNTPVKERLAMLEELKSRYPDTEEGERRGVACYTEDSGRTQMQEGFYRVTDYHEAFVIMAEDDTRLEEYIYDGKMHIILLEGMGNGLQKIGGSFVWVSEKERIPKILDAARERFFDIPYIVEEIGKLSSKIGEFTPQRQGNV